MKTMMLVPVYCLFFASWNWCNFQEIVFLFAAIATSSKKAALLACLLMYLLFAIELH